MPSSRPIRVYFGTQRPGERVVPLALAAGIGRDRIEDGLTPESGRFDRLLAEGTGDFQVAGDLAEADVCCFPHAIPGGRPPPEALEMAEAARRAGRPALLFDFGDDDTPTPLPYGLLYRTSLQRRLKGPREEAAPAPCRRVGTASSPLAKRGLPRVGFCGYVAPPWKRLLMRVRGQQRNVIGHRLRAAALGSLRHAAAAGRIEADLVVHRQFGGGFLRFRDDAERIARTRAAFEQNVLATDYTLCVRGAGNFSVRFYETLSAGRTPLFIDTDCVLPLEDEIDWSAHVIRVDQGEVDSCGKTLAELHEKAPESVFPQRQEANQRLWETTLEPLAFLRHICRKAMTRGTP